MTKQTKNGFLASQLSSFLAPKLLPSILIALLTVLYYPVFKSLVNEWYTDPNFSYGFLVPVMSGYLTWKKKEELKNALVSPCGFGILAFIAGIFCFFLGKLGAERFLMRISFIVVLTGIVLFLYGTQHFKILLFPIFFLIFMIPVPSILMNKITFPMQLIASKLATASIQLLGIPVLQEGNIIKLSGFSLEVAKACSGIRSLLSLLALGTIFAYFAGRSFWKRFLLIFSCFPIAIFVNSLRVTITAFLSMQYGRKAAEGFVHEFSGVVLFILALLLLILTNMAISSFGSILNKPNEV